MNGGATNEPPVQSRTLSTSYLVGRQARTFVLTGNSSPAHTRPLESGGTLIHRLGIECERNVSSIPSQMNACARFPRSCPVLVFHVISLDRRSATRRTRCQVSFDSKSRAAGLLGGKETWMSIEFYPGGGDYNENPRTRDS